MITVGEIGEFVAKYIGKRWPGDRQSIFEILDLVASEIWESGKFHGSTKWYYVDVRNDNTIITPHGYNVLLGCNINFKPKAIRQYEFLFHQNGPGDLPLVSKDYSDNVYDLGEFPIYRLLDKLCYPCEGSNKPKYKIAARLTGHCKEYPKTRIYGKDDCGNPIYSFTKRKGDEEEVCQCSEEDAEIYDQAIEGLEIPLTTTLTTYDIWFSEISEIAKDPTSSAVEYFAIDKYGVATPIARLEPFETSSAYRIYKVPDSCIKQRCVLGLFKISRPNKYIDPSEIFISDNKKAILGIAKGIDKKFNRDEIQEGNLMIADGILSLSRELKENSSNEQFPVQVSIAGTKKRKFI